MSDLIANWTNSCSSVFFIILLVIETLAITKLSCVFSVRTRLILIHVSCQNSSAILFYAITRYSLINGIHYKNKTLFSCICTFIYIYLSIYPSQTCLLLYITNSVIRFTLFTASLET